MKCNECGHVNLYKANYCQKCGHQFSDDEKKKAYDKTIYGILDRIETLYYNLSLQTITSHRYFRIAVIVVLLVCALGMF